MTTASLAALAAALRPGERLLGLDVGEKTVGLALSDVSRLVASPYGALARRDSGKDGDRIFAVVRREGVGGLVVGLPVGMDGREGPQCRKVRAFARGLAAALRAGGLGGLPIAFWDERLSTAAVERVLVEQADLSRRRQRRLVDKMAAAYILQGALDALREQASR
jgi:putative Holliday junction resolvase